MWRTVCRSSGLIRTNKCLGLLAHPSYVGTHPAPYHSTKTVFSPRDTGLKGSVRVRRSPLTSSGHLSKTPKASGAEIRSGVSSELQKLSVEDFGGSGPESQKPPKKDRKAKARLDEDEMVFGVAPCFLALTQGRRTPTRLFVKRTEGRRREVVEKVCEEALRRDVPIQHITRREMDKMTDGAVHQGLCLQASPLGFVTKEKSVNRQQKGEVGNRCPLWLVLDGVQDPMNLGSILRTAYFLGVDRVASSLRNSCPLTPVVSKASSGVMELMDVHGYENLPVMVKMKLKQGWQAVGTVGSEEAGSGASVFPCSEFKMSRPTLLLMGGEGFGLGAELRELCDVFLTVPPRRDLHPAVDSLNVSVATAIWLRKTTMLLMILILIVVYLPLVCSLSRRMTSSSVNSQPIDP